MVITDPVECSKCERSWCQDCLDKFSKTVDPHRCPSMCADPQFRDLHRVIKNLLYAQKFYCAAEKCYMSRESRE